MKYIRFENDSPFHNFGLEEYLLKKKCDDDYFFFYITKPGILIGKHQNTIEEINTDFVEAHNLVVSRRLTGGGAVYQDYGNINFVFIMNAKPDDINNFSKFVTPMVKALNNIGINAELSGRNDILVDGKKISGNAQTFANNRLLNHGTLLYDSNIDMLVSSLCVKDIKIRSKGIKSIRSRVGNITDYIDNKIDIKEFRELLIQELSKIFGATEYVLNGNELEYINDRAENHFSNWDYVYGYSPKFEITNVAKFSCGVIESRINVKNGLIEDIKLYGDFFSLFDIEILENNLKGQKYSNELHDFVDCEMLTPFFKDLDSKDFVDLLLGKLPEDFIK